MIINNEQGTKLTGFFKGIVVKHCDFGKCKIWIPGVYPDDLSENPDELPDAMQVAPMFGGSLKGNGVFSYPNVGSIVICGFLNEDQNLPIYWGVLQGGENAKEQYKDVRTEITEESVKTGDDARIHKIRVDKATIKIWESGHIQIKTFKDRKYCVNDEIPEVGCQIDIDESGTVNLKASSQLHITSPNIAIETQAFKLNSQSVEINSGNTIQITSNMSTTITSKDVLDIKAKTEDHMNGAFTVTAQDRINLDGNFVKVQGIRHPAIFL